MSLPGLSLSTPAPPETTIPSTITHGLPAGAEWRFEIDSNQSINVTVLSGTAELFGTELAPSQTYTFYHQKASIYTHHSCRLLIQPSTSSALSSEYIAEETPMTSYVNLHFALESLRQSSALHKRDGPRLLIVGPPNSGKTSLAKILAAYAAKVGSLPVVVNTDNKEGMLSLPGTLSAMAVGGLLDVEEHGGWGSSPTSGPSAVGAKLPLVYYWGGEGYGEGYRKVAARLAVAVGARLSHDTEASAGGLLVDTAGAIAHDKAGYEVISHLASEFRINVLVTLGSERLYSDMARRFPSTSGMTVLKVPKSGGCVERDEEFMMQSRQAQVRNYFFGDAKRTLSPHTQVVDFSQLAIYSVREAKPSQNHLAALRPGGDLEDDGDSKDDVHAGDIFTLTPPSPSLQNAILALVHAEPHAAHTTIRDASVKGFVYVVDIDMERQKVKLLAPIAGRLEPCAMVWAGEREGVIVGLVG